VVCLNVLEHVLDDRAGFRNLFDALQPGGRAVVLVPQGPSLFGTLDEVLEHQRRYTVDELRAKMAEAGFEVQRIFGFNRVTRPGWWVSGKVLRRHAFSRFQLFWFDRLVWLWRRLDRALPWDGVSIVAIGRKPG